MSAKHRTRRLINDTELDALWSADDNNTNTAQSTEPATNTVPISLSLATSYSADSLPSSVVSPANNVLTTVLSAEQQAKRARREALIKQKLQERKLAQQSSTDTVSTDSAAVTPLHIVPVSYAQNASTAASKPVYVNSVTAGPAIATISTSPVNLISPSYSPHHAPNTAAHNALQSPTKSPTSQIQTHNDARTARRLLSPSRPQIISPPLTLRSDNVQRIGSSALYATHNGHNRHCRTRSRSRERSHTSQSALTSPRKYAAGDARASKHSYDDRPSHTHDRDKRTLIGSAKHLGSPTKRIMPTISLIRTDHRSDRRTERRSRSRSRSPKRSDNDYKRRRSSSSPKRDRRESDHRSSRADTRDVRYKDR